MTKYVYPALFHSNEDGSFTITFPDLPGCISEGKSLENAMYMAQSALTQWIEYLTGEKHDVPTASNLQNIFINQNEFVSLIRADNLISFTGEPKGRLRQPPDFTKGGWCYGYIWGFIHVCNYALRCNNSCCNTNKTQKISALVLIR